MWSLSVCGVNIKFRFGVITRSPEEYEDKENGIAGDLCYAMKGREKSPGEQHLGPRVGCVLRGIASDGSFVLLIHCALLGMPPPTSLGSPILSIHFFRGLAC